MSKYYLFDNFILSMAIVSWASAQILKTIINTIKMRSFTPERLVGAGGMPSAHSAMMTATTVAVARQEGLSSAAFAISIVIALVVMYDAMGVRRAAGEHAKRINTIFFNHILKQEELNPMPKEEADRLKAEEEANKGRRKKKELFDPQKKLKEFLGHEPIEVLCGAILGAAWAFFSPIN